MPKVKEQRSKGFMPPNIAEVPDTMYQQGRQLARKPKDSALDKNMRNSAAYPFRRAEPEEEDEPLNDLLQEEEDLVSAHRKQVETLDILQEEMNIGTGTTTTSLGCCLCQQQPNICS
ncbi:hypothetical protein ACP4OV_013071 [Aristida adscensionis]